MKPRWPIIILGLCVAAFIFGLVRLFLIRFETGDVYPPYSSLRSDPLGTMVFYESLERLPDLKVKRDFSDSNRLPQDKRVAYLHLAAPSYEWRYMPEDLLREAEAFAMRGGRLVVTFYPEPRRPFAWLDPGVPGTGSKTNAAPRKRTSPKERGRSLLLRERWGMDFTHVGLSYGEEGAYDPAEVYNVSTLDLPATLTWHSGMVFTNLHSAWGVIYARRKMPVVIERLYGAGSIVMATDSYFLSNEALHEDPEARLLAWIVRGADHVVFDEAHLGIVERSGIAGLMRKYRLEPVLAALLLLAVLFIWKNSTSFVPPVRVPAGSRHVMGRDALAGFVNLLRRNVPRRDILKVCFDEWTRSLGRGSAHIIARVDRAQSLVEAEQSRPVAARDPVQAYAEICRVLKPGQKQS